MERRKFAASHLLTAMPKQSVYLPFRCTAPLSDDIPVNVYIYVYISQSHRSVSNIEGVNEDSNNNKTTMQPQHPTKVRTNRMSVRASEQESEIENKK